jgi:hypothetical protein
MMKPYLEAAGLTTTGRRAKLIASLQEYANDKSRWPKYEIAYSHEAHDTHQISCSQFLAAPAKVRGSMKGTRAKSSIAKRIDATFGTNKAIAISHQSKRTMLSLDDVRGQNYRADAFKWVSNLLQTCRHDSHVRQAAEVLVSSKTTTKQTAGNLGKGSYGCNNSRLAMEESQAVRSADLKQPYAATHISGRFAIQLNQGAYPNRWPESTIS